MTSVNTTFTLRTAIASLGPPEEFRGRWIRRTTLHHLTASRPEVFEAKIRVDIGYHDGMLIVSKGNQDTRTSRMNNLIEQYELRSREIENLIEFKNELVRLSDF